MMWWVNKFGRVTGPYSDEQIQSGIRQNQFTRLNKISNDQQTWMRLDQTKFWQPVSPAPESVAANPFETGAAPGKLRRPSATPTPGSTPFRRPAPAPEPEPEPVPPPRQTPPLSSRFDLNQKPSGGEGGGKSRKWLWIGGGIATCFAAALVAVVLVIGVKSRLGATSSSDGILGGSVSSQFDDVKKYIVVAHDSDGESIGTGFLVKMDGKKYVMSNDHVVRSSATPEMILVDGTKLKLGTFSTASDRDLARFEVVDYDGDCLEFSDKVPNIGDKIWVYGNSMGRDKITELKGKILGVGPFEIEIDATFVGGNSGSPIIDKNGNVIAVATYSSEDSKGLIEANGAKGTRFEKFWYSGVRATKVDWVTVDRREYEKECVRLDDIFVYLTFLEHYLICEDVSEEKFGQLILTHEDVYRKRFRGDEGQEFHEMLKEVSRSCRKWIASLLDRKNSAESVSRFREFNAMRKEALLAAQSSLTKYEWKCPLIQHGRGSQYRRGPCVDFCLEYVRNRLDQNSQKLKEINKLQRKWEGNGDEE